MKCLAAILAFLLATSPLPSEARLPHGGASAPGPNTVVAAAYATSAEVGQYEQITLHWAGSAPTGIISATWSGGGGSGTVSGFSQTGPLVQFWTTIPPGAGTYNLAVIANNGATATISGIVINAPGNDLAQFPAGTITGPSTVWQGQGFGYTNGNYSHVPIANYFVRGMAGPPTMTLSDTSGHTGDAAFFTTQAVNGAFGPQFYNGWAICATSAGTISTQTSFFVDVTFTDGVSTPLVKHVVIQNPAANYVTFYNAATIYNFTLNPNFLYGGNVVFDKSIPPQGGSNVVVGLLVSSTGALTFNDPSGLFTYAGGQILIAASNLIAANYGHYPVTVTATPGGSPETIDLYIAHAWQPVVAYVPNGTLYSSNPVTNGFGSWPIGHFYAYSDMHSGTAGTTLEQLDILSDSSGALSLWNQGNGLYLKSAVSAGTINAQFKASGISGLSTTMTLALPVTAGTTLTGALTGSITPSLTNFVPYANTLFPTGSPKTVIALTQAGFTPNWNLTQIDLANDGGTQVDNAQLTTMPGAPSANFILGATAKVNDGGNPANDGAGSLALTRYLLTGISGGSANVVATNLSALDHLTPKTDALTITTTDGNGTFDTETFNLVINWCSNATSEIQVGPSNANYPSPAYANAHALLQALWTDYLANGQNATMACANIRLLRGIPAAAPAGTTGWDYGPSSSFSDGYWPYPVHLFGDTSTQATFTGAISGTTLTVTGVSGDGVYPGDTISSGVGALKIMVMSQSSGTTHGNGTYIVHIGPSATSATASISATTMTTVMPRVVLDFGGTVGSTCCSAPGGSQQGCIMLTGGFDKEIDNVEIANCTNQFPGGTFAPGTGGTAGGFWTFDQDHGNIALYNGYVRNSDNGIINSGTGSHISLNRYLFAKNGNNGGGNHNIYISTSASFTLTNSVSDDVWRVHDVKSRAMYNRINHNVFADGVNGLGSVPVEITVGGDAVVDSNYILKTTNAKVEFNSIIVQTTPELVNGYGMAWPHTNIVVSNNFIGAGTPWANSWQPPIVGWTAWGWNVTLGPNVNIDLLRNAPITNAASGNTWWNLSQTLPAAWWSGVMGAAINDNGGNVAGTVFPDSAIELVDPVTGTPPFTLPPVGAFSCCQNPVSPYYSGSIASAPATYGMMMTVPSGSTSGTAVTNGLLAGIGADWVGLTGPPTYSFVNISSSNDNNKFTITPVGNGFQLYTNSTLCNPTCADGIYHVEVQGVGTGFNYGNTQPVTVNNVLTVLVGGFN